MTDQGPGWVIKTKEAVFETNWLTVHKYKCIAPTGVEVDYGAVEFKNLAIGVLPIDEKGFTWLVGQHRFPTGNNYSWEIPEGGGKIGVDPVESAARELSEEVNLKAAEYIPVLENVHLSNSVTSEVGFGYVALGLSPCHEHEPDDTENLSMRYLPVYEVMEMIDRGEITDMLTIAILLRAYHLANMGKLPEPAASAFRRG